MTTTDYLSALEARIQNLGSLILLWTIQRELDENLRWGFIKGRIEFVNGSILEFSEQLPIDRRKYRLHYMNHEGQLMGIFSL